MPLYHKVTWNFDELPQAVIGIGRELEQLLKPYYDSQCTFVEDSYWDPPWKTTNQPPQSGVYTRYRLWNNLESCKQFVNQVNQLRQNDPYLQNVISEATVHQDNLCYK